MLRACATCLQQAGRRVLSGIIYCLQRGYRWSDVPEEYGPAKTLYNRYRRWSEAGVFERIFKALAGEGADLSTLMIDTSHIKTHRIAANGVKKTASFKIRVGNVIILSLFISEKKGIG